MEATEYGASREALCICKVAVVGDVRRALACSARGRHGLKRRERGCAFAVAREFVDIDAGKNFSGVVRGWAD